MAKKKAARKKEEQVPVEVPQIPDYSEFVPEMDDLPEELLKRIVSLVKRQLDLQAALAKAEDLVKQVKSSLEQVRDRDLPDCLEEGGVNKLVLANGSTIEIETAIRASLGKSKKPEQAQKAIAWLVANGHAHLVSHTFAIPLTAGQDEFATALKERLAELSETMNAENDAWSIDVEDKTDVNAQRLSAWVRKELEAGNDVPENLFNVFRQRSAKVTV